MSNPNPALEVVILAAGQGTRMKSALPKVLHPLAGKPMLQHVLDTATGLGATSTHVVIGHGAELVRSTIGTPVNWVIQAEQKGTGHAVGQAVPDVDDNATVLVLYGDVPMASSATLASCVQAANAGKLGLVTAIFDDPAQLGRIVRDENKNITEIIEFKDAVKAGLPVDDMQEINSGILAVNGEKLKQLLAQVDDNNAQGEIYLTDIIAGAVQNNIVVEGIIATDPTEVTGVNDRAQLAELERIYQEQQASNLMAGGVTLADPSRLDIRGAVTAGRDCFIDINVVLEGDVVLGEGVSIGPGSVIKNTQLGDGVTVEAHTLVEGAVVAAQCSLGPFARIRPGTELAEGVKIGNFVETKKAKIGKGSKAGHLTYLGDAVIGADCNIGAGTVTCNYDGINKHQTTIGDDVFVGTNSTLVAPIEIASEAFIAAGSTLTTRVSAGDLAIGRGKQRNIKGWVRPGNREQKK